MWAELFWLEESQLPAHCGFGLFSPAHILCLLTIAAVITLICLIFRRLSDSAKERVIKLTAILLLLVEAFKLIVLALKGKLGIGYLPLHLCSMAIYTDLVAAFSRSGRVRSVLGEISAFTLLPAALMALLLPDWTMYPLFNFMSLSSFIWHGLQVLFPILLAVSGSLSPSVRHFWWNSVFLLATGIPVLIFDLVTGCNYFFLLRPIPGTPLETIYSATGPVLYVPTLFILFNAIILGEYLLRNSCNH